MHLSVQDFSPAADGITSGTRLFQQAIDILNANGGGTLIQ